MKSFEDFLINRHAEQYVGTDDCMPDDFDRYLEGLDIEDYINLADKYTKTLRDLLVECKQTFAVPEVHKELIRKIDEVI